MAHGTTVDEVASGVKPAARTTAGLPVYVGTAPINLGDPTSVNTPVLCYTLAEFQAKFGELGQVPSSAWDDWTLHEAASAHFSLFRTGPIVCVNVINPADADHIASGTGETHLIGTDGTVTLAVYGSPAQFGILSSTVVVYKNAVEVPLSGNYTLAFDDDGHLVLTIVDGGALAAGNTITVDFDYLDPTGVDAADIIGGYSAGTYKGLEVVEQVYPSLRLVPGLILAPQWSKAPTVAARMAAIAASINGSFKAMAICDLDCDPAEIATYAAAPAWKSDNGYTDKHQIVCYLKGDLDGDVYWLSTLVACAIGITDKANDDIPFASPSNKDAKVTSSVDVDGTEILLTKPQANTLGAQGIVTLLNSFAGWRIWGNRTGAYPGSTDTKDVMIPVRRMFDWFGNTVILTTERDVDDPANRRLIDSLLAIVGTFINGLITKGALIDGEIEFREEDNTVADLADGKVAFHVTLTPPSPAEEISFTLQYDAEALSALFA